MIYRIMLWCAVAMTTGVHAQGPALEYAFGFPGSSGATVGYALLADDTGNHYAGGLAGGSSGWDADPAADSETFLDPGLFLTASDPEGSLTWAFSLGQPLPHLNLRYISTGFDHDGNVLVAGTSAPGQVDFDPLGDGEIQTSTSGLLFTACYTTSGQLLWVNSYPVTGSVLVDVGGISSDGSGNIAAAFTVRSNGGVALVDVDPGSGTTDITMDGSNNFLMFQMQSSGEMNWFRHIQPDGTNSANHISGVTASEDGAIYFTGELQGSCDFDPDSGSEWIIEGAGRAVFLSRFDEAGALVWAFALQGGISGRCHSVAPDLEGNVIITGEYNATPDFDPGEGLYAPGTSPGGDIYLASYSPEGLLNWAHFFVSDSGNNSGRSVHCDRNGYILLGGSVSSDVDLSGNGSGLLVNTSTRSAFLARFTASGECIWAMAFAGSPFSLTLGVASDGLSNIWATGLFRGTADFDPSVEEEPVTGSSTNTLFMARFSPCEVLFEETTGCEGSVIDLPPFQVTESGVYGVSSADSGGCESITFTTVTFSAPPSADVSVEGSVLTSAADADSWQWFACPDSEPVSGENGNVFAAVEPGSYGVEITAGGCTVVSDCYEVLTQHMSNLSGGADISLFPNPSRSGFTLRSAVPVSRILVYDLSGRMIREIPSSCVVCGVREDSLSPGHYLIEVQRAGYAPERLSLHKM
jgi:hypothetical protein